MADRAAILQIAQRSIEKNAEEREASTKAKLHALEVELTGLRAERGTMSASLSTQAAQILQLREALANLVEDLRIARKPVLDADAVERTTALNGPPLSNKSLFNGIPVEVTDYSIDAPYEPGGPPELLSAAHRASSRESPPKATANYHLVPQPPLPPAVFGRARGAEPLEARSAAAARLPQSTPPRPLSNGYGGRTAAATTRTGPCGGTSSCNGGTSSSSSSSPPPQPQPKPLTQSPRSAMAPHIDALAAALAEAEQMCSASRTSSRLANGALPTPATQHVPRPSLPSVLPQSLDTVLAENSSRSEAAAAEVVGEVQTAAAAAEVVVSSSSSSKAVVARPAAIVSSGVPATEVEPPPTRVLARPSIGTSSRSVAPAAEDEEEDDEPVVVRAVAARPSSISSSSDTSGMIAKDKSHGMIEDDTMTDWMASAPIAATVAAVQAPAATVAAAPQPAAQPPAAATNGTTTRPPRKPKEVDPLERIKQLQSELSMQVEVEVAAVVTACPRLSSSVSQPAVVLSSASSVPASAAPAPAPARAVRASVVDDLDDEDDAVRSAVSSFQPPPAAAAPAPSAKAPSSAAPPTPPWARPPPWAAKASPAPATSATKADDVVEAARKSAQEKLNAATASEAAADARIVALKAELDRLEAMEAEEEAAEERAYAEEVTALEQSARAAAAARHHQAPAAAAPAPATTPSRSPSALELAALFNARASPTHYQPTDNAPAASDYLRSGSVSPASDFGHRGAGSARCISPLSGPAPPTAVKPTLSRTATAPPLVMAEAQPHPRPSVAALEEKKPLQRATSSLTRLQRIAQLEQEIGGGAIVREV